MYVGVEYERISLNDFFSLNRTTKTFSFQSAAPVEFQFRIDILSQDPALTIKPMEGNR